MGLKGKFLGALKNLGGCMSAPKADNNEPMKQTKLCDPLKGQEEMEVAKDSDDSKNDGVDEERNIVGNQVTLDLLGDDENEEKEDEVSTRQEKAYEDEGDDDGKEKNNSEDKPNFGSEN